MKNTASLTSRVRARSAAPLPSRPAVSFAVTGTPVPSMQAHSSSGSGEGGSGTSARAVIALTRSRTAAALAAPLASAERSTRLAVRCTPAIVSSIRDAFANGPSAAARSVIAASPGDIDCPTDAELGVRRRKPVPALGAVVPGSGEGDRAGHRADEFLAVGGEVRLVAPAARHPRPAVARVGGQQLRTKALAASVRQTDRVQHRPAGALAAEAARAPGCDAGLEAAEAVIRAGC